MTRKKSKLYFKSDWRRLEKPQKTKTEGYRSETRRDLGRLIHSASFRRLQGKTQLFPNADSDFFRNRLTHSLEVAQIAKAIALKLNNENDEFEDDPIDLDLVEFSALAHDIGHPPFGHIGEEALDECMSSLGGFEGNAQTIRILTRLEKRDVGGRQSFDFGEIRPIIDGADERVGLNITFRSMASVLKYDNQIPSAREPSGAIKGYYYFDSDLVRRIKSSVSADEVVGGKFKSIECSIMDVADDIAYSTYDMEDAFKAGILSPLEIVRLTQNSELFETVAAKVTERLIKFGYRELGAAGFTREDATHVVHETFRELFRLKSEQETELKEYDSDTRAAMLAAKSAEASNRIASDGYYRTHYTSAVVQYALGNIELIYYAPRPSLSTIRLSEECFCLIEVMKNLTYEVVIRSPSLKLIEFRGKKIIHDIFNGLSNDVGMHLLPEDHQNIQGALNDPAQKKRVVCDFIAGMTDRYALEFYQRLFGALPASVYKPL